MEYLNFIKSKKHSSIDSGIKVNFMPGFLFEYQKFAVEKAVNKGRCAVFFDTGLGKTLIQLVVAKNYINHTNKPTLIITPLAVAFQFIKECERFDISDIEYSKNGKHSKDIVVCNYERLDKFSPADFDCVVLDESSILKNFEGSTKKKITSFVKNVKYRFLFTATPSPNDFIELGTSSEALGYLGYTDMLTKYFTNNEDTIKPQNIGTKWILKGHAESDFFSWVSSWSLSMRKPSDLGFDDSMHVLPKLITNYHSVKNEKPLVVGGQFSMFTTVAKRLTEIKAESKNTVTQRCEKAYELASNKETSVYWCNRNDESKLLSQLDKTAYEIKGSMKLDKKEEVLIAFANGDIKKLITKPKMTAFGLNWQHCNHTVYFPTFSYEQYYQSIRRFWRFGQKNDVTVDLVYSEGQKRVLDSLVAKTDKANKLFSQLNKSINNSTVDNVAKFNKKIQLPNFLK